MAIFEGSAVALATPFKSDFRVDYECLEKLLKFQLENDTDALVICGTTGEASTLTEDEFFSIVKFAVSYVDGKVPIIAGAGANDTAYAIHLSSMAKDAGANALMHVTPYYNKTSQRGLIKHYEKISNVTDLPIMLYSVQSRASMNIEPMTVLELSNIPNIVAIKEASSNINQIVEIAALLQDKPDFAIYSGNDNEIIPILSIGGKGVVSTVGNIIPKTINSLVHQYFNQDFSSSLKLQLYINRLTKAMFCDINPIPLKYALSHMQLCENVLREPLIQLEDSDMKMMDKVFADYNL